MPSMKAPKTTKINAADFKRRRRQIWRVDTTPPANAGVVVWGVDAGVIEIVDSFVVDVVLTGLIESFLVALISSSSSFKTSIKRQRPGNITMKAEAHAPGTWQEREIEGSID